MPSFLFLRVCRCALFILRQLLFCFFRPLFIPCTFGASPLFNIPFASHFRCWPCILFNPANENGGTGLFYLAFFPPFPTWTALVHLPFVYFGCSPKSVLKSRHCTAFFRFFTSGCFFKDSNLIRSPTHRSSHWIWQWVLCAWWARQPKYSPIANRWLPPLLWGF